jgi:hypothetical protein
MAIEHGFVHEYKKELHLGTHVWGTDTFKIALYSSDADLELADITAYTTTGETGMYGYTAGGQTLTLASGFPKLNPTAQGEFPAEKVYMIDFNDVTFTGLVGSDLRAALIYNSSKSNKAVCVLDFGSAISVSGDVVFSWPTPDVLSAIMRVI